MGIVIYYQYICRYITHICCWCCHRYPSTRDDLITAPKPKPKPVSSYRDRKHPNLTVDTNIPSELDLTEKLY